jgi:two-component system NtrC family sensor kinase
VSRLRHIVRARPWLVPLLLVCELAIIVAALRGHLDSGDTGLIVSACVGALFSLVAASQLVGSHRALVTVRSELAGEHLRLERMFRDARIGMALSDETHRWVRVNPALCEMLGYDEEDLVGHAPAEFTHPDDVQSTTLGFEAMASAERTGIDFEKRYIARDGSVIWVRVVVSSTLDRETRAAFHSAQIENITERKRMEAAYAGERGLLDAFLENVPEQVYFKDLDGRFLRVSRLHATKLGFDAPQELVGKTDADVFGEEHAAQAFADEQRMIRTGEPVLDLEEPDLFSPSGRTPHSDEPAWILTTKLPLRDQFGEIIGTFGISRDITLRKRAEAALIESEKRWRSLLSHLQEIVMLVDQENRLVYATPSIERWLGYAPEELIGDVLTATGHPEDSAALTLALTSVTPGESVSLSHRVRHHDGSWHTLESTLVCLREDPVVQAVLIASRDVTDEVAMDQERERRELERRVSHRLEAVGQLAAGIAHEINTPLQFLGDSVTFLKDAVEELLMLTGRYRELLWEETPLDVFQRRAIMSEAEDQADVEYLIKRIPAAFERTTDGVARVRSIVQAMKRFSHASSSETAPADINEAIETTLQVCRNEYKYVAEIALHLGELPMVTCNIGELNQVFLNLIINAAQAIEQQVGDSGRQGEIRIGTEVRDGHVVVTVADTGPGIPLELQERIYEPFFTTKEVGKGTGQGLALARTTVERHLGSIECDSRPGDGTRFTIRLPLSPAVADAARVAA